MSTLQANAVVVQTQLVSAQNVSAPRICISRLMLLNQQESPSMCKERVQTTLDALLHDHADQLEFCQLLPQDMGPQAG